MSEAPGCRGCGASPGELHEWFCLQERCPFCGGQLAACGCIKKVLELTSEEAKALDGYVDDSEEPLQSVMRRWREALTQKGRIPWTPPPAPEKVLRVGLHRERGFEYALRGQSIARARFQRAGNPRRSENDWEKVCDAHFEREAGYVYLIDADGDVARVKR